MLMREYYLSADGWKAFRYFRRQKYLPAKLALYANQHLRRSHRRRRAILGPVSIGMRRAKAGVSGGANRRVRHALAALTEVAGMRSFAIFVTEPRIRWLWLALHFGGNKLRACSSKWRKPFHRRIKLSITRRGKYHISHASNARGATSIVINNSNCPDYLSFTSLPQHTASMSILQQSLS